MILPTIRDLRLPPSEKLTLLILASHLPNVFPSIDTLTEETGLSRATVHRCLQSLKRRNYIIWEKTGRSSSYTITLPMDDGRSLMVRHQKSHGEITDVSQLYSKNTSKNQDKNINSVQEKMHEEFEQFYSKYPNKKGDKNSARQRFVKTRKKGTTTEKIIGDLQAYIRNKPDWQSFAHCATWLKQMMDGDKWRNDVYENTEKTSAVKRLQAQWQKYGNIGKQPWATDQTRLQEERLIQQAFYEATDSEKTMLIQEAPEGANLPSNVVRMKAKTKMRVVQCD